MRAVRIDANQFLLGKWRRDVEDLEAVTGRLTSLFNNVAGQATPRAPVFSRWPAVDQFEADESSGDQGGG